MITSFSARDRGLRIRGRALLPIVQGGMGVGVSAHRLAGNVAALGAVGTISAVDLRHHHPDLVAATTPADGAPVDAQAIDRANLVALDRELRAARELAQGEGLIAVNVMRAVTQYAAYVRQACESGAGAIVMGAGLPLDLPELVADFPEVALIPILSDARGAGLVVRRWMRQGRLPDAIVLEHPGFAGGHLGATRLEEVDDARFAFDRVIPETLETLSKLGVEPGAVPLIAAGGINSVERVRAALSAGASAVQLGTAFAVTCEGDAHPEFKRVLAQARPEDIVTFMSVAGLPARAVRTPWLDRYLKHVERLQSACRQSARRCVMQFDCLIQCGLRDGIAKAGQFCIDRHLVAALHGDLRQGLFFRGSEALPFGNAVRPVRELIDYLMQGVPSPREPTAGLS